MSIRPDVLPPAVMKELARLQDKITPFSCEVGKAVGGLVLSLELKSQVPQNLCQRGARQRQQQEAVP